MACNCKHMSREIEDGQNTIAKLRELFIKRMTVDSETHDRRRKDFNQAIFYYKSREDVDSWNEIREQYGFPPKRYGDTYPVCNEMNMDMVLTCFDNAVKDWRKTFCDVENCNRR